MSDGRRYSWVVRDSDDEPWTLLAYRWTDREAALEESSHWLNCSRHRYAQVRTVEVTGDGWTEIQASAASPEAGGAAELGRICGGLPFPRPRFQPEYTFGTPVPPTTFLPMAPEPDPPPSLSRKAFAKLREAMGREGLTP